ncbi:MAG TPA: universal stress protein [Deltaproteobacteria bacterium]|jgi:nucleotide-binding universal stress UspA family protein|nr:universal stress protein [Deltaproteobacteria bacterium]HIJ75546.1 universal stress protein [Deltaproteobacteria bacterium]
MFSNLLVPLDGSKLAESVLPVVRRLAERLGCEVKLLHVIEKRPPSRIHGDAHLQDAAGAERYLELIVERLKSWGLNVSSHVHEVPQGDVPRCIAEHAEELEQDLIVLCTHGSGGFKRFVFGTNAEQVLMHGRTPVVLIKTDEYGRAPDFGPRSIIAFLDCTPHSDPVLTACSELAMIFQAKLHLLYVVPTAGSVTPEEVPGARLAPTTTRLLLDLETEQTIGRMKEHLQLLLARNVEASGNVERGQADPAIVGTATDRQADIVAMATMGLAGIGAFWANDLVSRICASYEGALLLFPVIER